MASKAWGEATWAWSLDVLVFYPLLPVVQFHWWRHSLTRPWVDRTVETMMASSLPCYHKDNQGKMGKRGIPEWPGRESWEVEQQDNQREERQANELVRLTQGFQSHVEVDVRRAWNSEEMKASLQTLHCLRRPRCSRSCQEQCTVQLVSPCQPNK